MRTALAHRYAAAMLAAAAGQGCAPSVPPGFGPSSDYIEDTYSWDGTHDPVSWLHDYWTPTAEACQPPDPFTEPGIWQPYYEDVCQEALMADRKVDVESFASDYRGSSGLAQLLEGAFHLLGRDLGSVDALRTPEDDLGAWAVREAFIEQVELVAEELGQQEVRQALYNLVMSTILVTEYDPNSDYWAAFSRRTRTLYFYGWGYGQTNACLLVHEATHGWQDRGHVECPEGHVVEGDDYSGRISCDSDWAGAYGFTTAAAYLMYQGALVEDPEHTELPLWVMDLEAAMILEE